MSASPGNHVGAHGLACTSEESVHLVQAQKVYVQDRLRESGKLVWDLLEAGGHFYICGDAAHMAGAVEEALLHIIDSHQVCITAIMIICTSTEARCRAGSPPSHDNSADESNTHKSPAIFCAV